MPDRPPSGEDQSERLASLVAGAGQIVEERGRETVGPMQVVNDDERGTQRHEGPMSGLEETHRLDWFGGRRCAERHRVDDLSPFGNGS